ncbi:MAG: DUF4432 family protein [Lachnospiraceae bacterium]|nr:DUF4432 family protein [Lachnospiraceae bacterium]
MERIEFKSIKDEIVRFNDDFTVEKEILKDPKGYEINLLKVSNGLLRFSVIIERAMDIGEIFYKDEKMSWQRDINRLINPDGVDLKEDGAWEKGFYQAVASLGPEVFGTPDEIRTPHGTGAFSKADHEKVYITHEDDKLTVAGLVPVKGYGSEPQYEKWVYITLKKDSCFFERKEAFKNLTKETLPLDTGYHVQLNGSFMKEGGRYVLPVSSDRMLLRDSAPTEISPKAIYPEKLDFMPIRCYQYVPEKVYGIEEIPSFSQCEFLYKEPDNITAEMLVNRQNTVAAVIIRPLSSFGRTLLAKRNDGEAMYAVEPCRTRPNSIRQKAIDGELKYIEPGEIVESEIVFGFSDDKETVDRLVSKIESAASYEKEIAEARRKEK